MSGGKKGSFRSDAAISFPAAGQYINRQRMEGRFKDRKDTGGDLGWQEQFGPEWHHPLE